MLDWELLGRRCRTKRRAIDCSNIDSLLALRDRAIVWSAGGRLVGGVGATAVLKSWDILMQLVCSIRIVASSTWSIWQHGITRDATRMRSLRKVWQSSWIGTVRIVGKLSRSQWLGIH